MTLEFKNLAKKDYAKAIDFAIEGMHFDWYLNNPFLLKLYGRYFLYLELNRASHIIAGYSDNQLVGLVLADIYKHPKAHSSFWQNAYIKMADFIQKFFFQDSVGSYDQANQKMFRNYQEKYQPDGEIIFLAADPNIQGQGIGSQLLQELEKHIPPKEIFLYTDNACNYHFYERKGFKLREEEEILLEISNRQVALTCLLYSKEMTSD